MDMAEFKKVWNHHDGWNRCQAIIFDNSGRWIFSDKYYHEYYETIKDANGYEFKRRIPDSPFCFAKVDADGNPMKDKNGMPVLDYMDLHDCLTINEECGTLERKRYFVGVTPEDIKNGTPLYTIEVRHVENVQLMCFCDENNLEARPLFPSSMT